MRMWLQFLSSWNGISTMTSLLSLRTSNFSQIQLRQQLSVATMGEDVSPRPGPQSLTLSTLSHILVLLPSTSCIPLLYPPFFGGMNGPENPFSSPSLQQHRSCRNSKQRSLSFPNHHAVHVQTRPNFSSAPVHSSGSPHSQSSQQHCWFIVSFLFSENQTLGPRIRSPSNTCPTVFRHNIQSTPQQANLSCSSQEAILNSLVLSTLSACLTGWNCLKAYHTTYRLPFPSLDTMSICNFVTHAHSIQNIWSRTIQTYPISFFIELATGVPCPSASHSHVTMLIKGLRKQELPLPASR